jgi:hypothetical protein
VCIVGVFALAFIIWSHDTHVPAILICWEPDEPLEQLDDRTFMFRQNKATQIVYKICTVMNTKNYWSLNNYLKNHISLIVYVLLLSNN